LTALWLCALAAFVAAAVEAVEALTIVLAAGIARRWPPALAGAAAAIALLAAAVAAFGPLLATIPLHIVRLIAGAAILWLGIVWMRKAILRAAGRKAHRDEAAAFEREHARLSAGDTGAFATAFNGVFAEGMEVVVIVLSFGAGRPDTIRAASAGAALAVVLVALAGFAIHRPLARVPENAMKWIVATVLLAFGTLWIGEGLGMRWPFGDVFVLALLVAYTAASAGAVALVRSRAQAV